MDVAVIGAGPSGLAAAMRLSQNGERVTLYESAGEIGGLARSLDLFGRRVDLGSHVLSEDVPEVADILRRLLGDRLHRVPLRRGVVIDDRCFAYPFRPSDIVRKSGPMASLALLDGFLRRRTAVGSSDAPESAEEWIIGRYGRAFHDRFFRPYAEKLWGIPSGCVDASFARNLTGETSEVPRPSAASRAWARMHPAPSAHGRSKSFLYPSDGIGALSDALAVAAAGNGAEILTSTKIERLTTASGRVRGGVVVDGVVRHFDAVIAAAPLPIVSRLIDAPPEIARAVDTLRTRSTVLVYVAVDAAAAFPELWRYLCDPDLSVGRVANLARWQSPDDSAASSVRTVLCCEIWCDRGAAIWTERDQVVTQSVIDELADAGVVDRATVVGTHVVRLPATHLVPELGSPVAVAAIRNYLDSIEGLYIVGRGAGLQDVATTLQSGLVAADRVLHSSAVANSRME